MTGGPGGGGGGALRALPRRADGPLRRPLRALNDNNDSTNDTISTNDSNSTY